MNTTLCLKDLRLSAPAGRRLWQRLRRCGDRWRLAAAAVAALTLLPLASIVSAVLQPAGAVWAHIAETLLADLLVNTGLLVTGVLAGTAVLGVGLAWLTGVCEFPGRRPLAWALLLPLAMPSYVLAFVVLGLFDYAGPVQGLIRQWAPALSRGVPEMRSAGGIIAVMTLALYPYVYLLARNAFQTQGKRAIEAAQSLGLSRRRAFFSVALPMARPWIAGGLMLVMMETLAEFGAVAVFNYDTFTTAIYKAWYGMFSLGAAAQLSALLVLGVTAVVAAEQHLRARMRYHQGGRGNFPAERIVLSGGARWAATLVCTAVVLAGFAIPFTQLLLWAVEVYAVEFSDRYAGLLLRSLFFALLATAAVVAVALLLAYAQRRRPDRTMAATVRVATLGYALPGTVLAVGIGIGLAALDHRLMGLRGADAGPLLQGTLLAVLAAYLIRFLAVGFNTIGSAMQRVTVNLDEAAAGMAVTGTALLRRVHLPMLRRGLLTAAMLVFVDVMKEMPVTLMTRPFGWDTLAVKVFELTSEGEWQRAALPAVALVLAGLLPVMVMTRKTETGWETDRKGV